MQLVSIALAHTIQFVMPVRGTGIHDVDCRAQVVDGRNKSGHDEVQ